MEEKVRMEGKGWAKWIFKDMMNVSIQMISTGSKSAQAIWSITFCIK